MNFRVLIPALLLIFFDAALPQETVVLEEETLRYSINWPSGLSLGEGELAFKRTRSSPGSVEQLEYSLNLEAAIPGFAVKDRFQSTASPQFCSLSLEKDSSHGKKVIREKTTVDLEKKTATRVTVGGGKSEIPVSACTKDALTFLFFLRSELNSGRLPPPQMVLFGAPYRIRLEYAGAKDLNVGAERLETDRLIASFQGPASEMTFEMFFARDPARTPVLIKAPLSMGTFSLELVR